MARDPRALIELAAAELGIDLGLGKDRGHNSWVMASLTRLILFGPARWSGPGELQVRQFLPPLTTAFLSRLSPRPSAPMPEPWFLAPRESTSAEPTGPHCSRRGGEARALAGEVSGEFSGEVAVVIETAGTPGEGEGGS